MLTLNFRTNDFIQFCTNGATRKITERNSKSCTKQAILRRYCIEDCSTSSYRKYFYSKNDHSTQEIFYKRIYLNDILKNIKIINY